MLELGEVQKLSSTPGEFEVWGRRADLLLGRHTNSDKEYFLELETFGGRAKLDYTHYEPEE